jgi:hypothetical protein
VKNNQIIAAAIAIASLLWMSVSSQSIPRPEIREFTNPQQVQADNWGSSFDCSFNAVYGQPPFLDYIAGIPSIAIDMISAETGAFDNYFNVDQPITGVTFWGIFADMDTVCQPQMPVQFRIRFFETDQNFPPAPVYQQDVFLSGEQLLHQGFPVYRFEAIFPDSIVLPPEGIISILQVASPFSEPCFFHWIVSMAGDQQSVIYSVFMGQVEEMQMVPVDWAFCLNRAPMVPLPHWPLLAAIFMIVAVTVLRYRKFL